MNFDFAEVKDNVMEFVEDKIGDLKLEKNVKKYKKKLRQAKKDFDKNIKRLNLKEKAKTLLGKKKEPKKGNVLLSIAYVFGGITLLISFFGFCYSLMNKQKKSGYINIK